MAFKDAVEASKITMADNYQASLHQHRSNFARSGLGIIGGSSSFTPTNISNS